MEANARSETEPGSLVPEALLIHLRNSVRGLFQRPIQADEQFDFRRLYRYALERSGVKPRRWEEEAKKALYAKFGDLAESLHFDAWVWRLRGYLCGEKGHLPPIGHLVLQAVLGISFDESMEYSNGSLWRCPNPVTDCGRISARRRKRGRSANTDRIECCKCGFAARIDASSPLGSKPVIRSIVRSGHELDTYLLRAVAEERSIERMSVDIGLPTYKICNILRALGVETGKRLKDSITRNKAERRRLLCEYLERHPKATRTDIATDMRPVYSMLVKYDREWFEAQAPVSLCAAKKGYRVGRVARKSKRGAPAWAISRQIPKLNSKFQDLIVGSGNSKT